MTGSKRVSNIQVNMSAALRFYEKGKQLLEDKQEEIKKLQSAVEEEIENCYKRKRSDVMRRIDDIEANPSTYGGFLNRMPLVGHTKITKIQVFEEFDSLERPDIDDYIEHLHQTVEKGEKYVENYRSSIEDLFDEEANAAAMFDLAEEVIS